MPRQSQLILLILMLGVIGFLSYYTYTYSGAGEKAAELDVLPNSTSLVLRCNSLESLNKALISNTILQKLTKDKSPLPLVQTFDRVDSLFRKQKVYRSVVEEHPPFLAFVAKSANYGGWVFIHNSNGIYSPDNIKSLVKQWYPQSVERSHTFKNQEIIDIRDAKKNPIVSFCIYNETFICSEQAALVEDALSADMGNSSATAFVKHIRENMDGAQLFINHRAVFGLSAYLGDPTQTGYRAFPSEVAFEAFQLASDSSSIAGSASNSLVGDKSIPVEATKWAADGTIMDLAEHFPASSGFTQMWSVSDVNNFAKWRAMRVDISAWLPNVDTFSQLSAIFSGTWGIALHESAIQQDSSERILVIKLKDTLQYLKPFTKGSLSKSPAPVSLGQYRGYAMHKVTLDANWAKCYMGKMINDFKSCYLARKGEWLTLTPQKGLLVQTIDELADSKNLISRQVEKRAMASQAKGAYHVEWVKPNSLEQSLQRRMPRIASTLDRGVNVAFASFAHTYSYPNLGSKLLAYSDKLSTNSSQILFSVSLSDTVASQPTFIPNPSDSSQPYVAFQTTSNTLYCLDFKGAMVFKVALNSKIVGQIHSLDFYGNGERQILFALDNAVDMLDMKGRHVGSYPLTMASPITGGVEVAFKDTTNQPSYYFITTRAGQSFGFDLIGRPLPNWNGIVTDSTLTSAPKFIQIGKSRIMYAASHKGTMYIWPLLGGKPIIAYRTWVRMDQVPFFKHKGDFMTAQMVCGNSSGRVVVLGMNGQIRKFDVDKGASQGILSGFSPYPSKSAIDFTYAYGYSIKGMTVDSVPKFKLLMSEKAIISPQAHVFTSKTYLSTIEPKTHKLQLFTDKGKPVTGFPIRGSTPYTFFILPDQKTLLLATGTTDRLFYIYKINMPLGQ